MPIRSSVEVYCPYCGLINTYYYVIESRYIPKQIVTCDIEQGGCDRDFVIEPKVQIDLSADVYKIERI
ncbi:MAG: hypothetical protein GX892_12735 [Thermoanaerobacteraceae bacterium]|nr:hypothetical protein [Thermoanaerobacteraceae bacterium]